MYVGKQGVIKRNATQMITNDFALFAYFVEMLICYSAFLLFLWWGVYKYKNSGCRPTNVYILVMLLFLCRAYGVHVAFHARNIIGDLPDYQLFLQSSWWHTRVLPQVIVELLILCCMLLRVYNNFIKNHHKRVNDKDGDDV